MIMEQTSYRSTATSLGITFRQLGHQHQRLLRDFWVSRPGGSFSLSENVWERSHSRSNNLIVLNTVSPGHDGCSGGTRIKSTAFMAASSSSFLCPLSLLLLIFLFLRANATERVQHTQPLHANRERLKLNVKLLGIARRHLWCHSLTAFAYKAITFLQAICEVIAAARRKTRPNAAGTHPGPTGPLCRMHMVHARQPCILYPGMHPPICRMRLVVIIFFEYRGPSTYRLGQQTPPHPAASSSMAMPVLRQGS
eukprot:08311_3